MIAELAALVKDLHTKVNYEGVDYAAHSQATATRELGSGQMLILEGACRRALCDGGYSVRDYFGHRESKQAFTQSWVILNQRLLL